VWLWGLVWGVLNGKNSKEVVYRDLGLLGFPSKVGRRRKGSLAYYVQYLGG